MEGVSIQKPCLKWVGGKTQIIKAIIELIPKEINNYHEIFLGGGSVLLAVLSLKKANKIKINGKIYANDINKSLIYFFKHIQSNKDELYTYIESYINVYKNLTGNDKNRNPANYEEAILSKENYYYWLRKKYNKFNKTDVECSALFIIINKLCFRGMYREGPNGFNVPYGHYKKTPTIIKKEELDYISDLIKDVIFIHSDYKLSLKKINQNDFVYLDPPYAPETKHSFVGYAAGGFTQDNHKELFAMIKNINQAKFLLSNSNVELVVTSFKGYSIKKIEARRTINARNPGSKTEELLIYN